MADRFYNPSFPNAEVEELYWALLANPKQFSDEIDALLKRIDQQIAQETDLANLALLKKYRALVADVKDSLRNNS